MDGVFASELDHSFQRLRLCHSRGETRVRWARVRRGSAWMTDLSGGETIVELAFPLAGAFLFSHLGSRFLQARGKLISVFGDRRSKPEEGRDERCAFGREGIQNTTYFGHTKSGLVLIKQLRISIVWKPSSVFDAKDWAEVSPSFCSVCSFVPRRRGIEALFQVRGVAA